MLLALGGVARVADITCGHCRGRRRRLRLRETIVILGIVSGTPAELGIRRLLIRRLWSRFTRLVLDSKDKDDDESNKEQRDHDPDQGPEHRSELQGHWIFCEKRDEERNEKVMMPPGYFQRFGLELLTKIPGDNVKVKLEMRFVDIARGVKLEVSFTFRG